MARSTTLVARRAPRTAVSFDSMTSYGAEGLPGRFTLNYQPEIDLGSGEVVACEALLRWQHPTFGTLRPGESLGGSGWESVLIEVDRWAMFAVCHQAAAWRAEGRPIQVAVNTTADHVLSDTYPLLVREALEASGLAPHALGIDVPLAALAMHPAATRDAIDELGHLGIGVFIDGVMSDGPHLAFRGLQVDSVKIPLHRSGPRRPGLHPFVEGALELTRDAGATSVAKAVETIEQLEEVRALGFDRAFGHVYSPPVEAPDLHEAVAPDGQASTD